MWAIRFLKGPLAGQIIPLKHGENNVGRGMACQIRLASQGISKEHTKITVSDVGVSVTDLNSTNGTFVNGIKVRTRPLKKGDRVGLHDLVFELLDQTAVQGAVQNELVGQLPVAFDGNAALNTQSQDPQFTPEAPAHYNPNNFGDVMKHYFETVALPGVYRLGQIFEMKWVLGSFVLGFVALVTALSVIPMIQISKSSIEKESQRRALTIAQGLHDRYVLAVRNGNENGFDTRFAEREEGVRAAFILRAVDGSIIAPVTNTGAYAKEPFVHSARKKDEILVEQLDSETIGASVPVQMYDQETGLTTPKAYAMVLYSMGSLAVDNGRIISLFVQVLGIALLIGFILYMFMYRLIEAPIRHLLFEINKASRSGESKIESPYNFPIFQNLVLNINSLLSRAGGPTETSGPQKDIYTEATQLVRIIAGPALAVDPQMTVIAINSSLASAMNVGLSQLDSTSVSQMPDDALAALVPELLQKSLSLGDLGIQSTPIHFKERDLELNLKPIQGVKGVDYFIFTLASPSGGDE